MKGCILGKDEIGSPDEQNDIFIMWGSPVKI